MSSVRLRQDQIDRLRASGMGAAIIRHAVMRYRRGDFVIGAQEKPRDKQNILRVFAIWKKPKGIEDWQLREILDCHFAKKDAILQARLRKEMEAVEREINETLALMQKRGYILEEEADDET